MKLISSLSQGYWYFIASSTGFSDAPLRHNMTTHAPNQPLLWPKKGNWAMQAGGSQVEEKPELLYTSCKVPACMASVLHASLFSLGSWSQAIFLIPRVKSSWVWNLLQQVTRGTISLSLRGEAKHSSSIKLALRPELQRLKGLRERHQGESYMLLFTPLG